MTNDNCFDDILDFYINDKTLRFELKAFQDQVQLFFLTWPGLVYNNNSVIHSIKTRIKDPDHLRDKLFREKEKSKIITLDNFQREITDLIGVRVLYLYHDQFKIIHQAIMDNIEIRKEWKLVEDPKAYTWDPEKEHEYKLLGIKSQIKETFYTSVHYVIKPYNDNSNPVCCEIQVRTLFEEIWGEIDHTINYPHPTNSIACSEQIKTLAKFISSGTRLSDSIFRSYNEFLELTHQDKFNDI